MTGVNRESTIFVITMSFNILFMGLVLGDPKLDIIPEKCTSNLGNTVQFSCKPQALDSTNVNEITMMKISRKDETEPIAFLTHCSNITYGTKMETRFEAQGYISKNFDETYLSLTLVDPRSEDTGTYDCEFFYIDTTGDWKEEKTSGNLVVEKLDAKSLEIVLNELRNKITQVENNSKSQIQKQRKKITRVEDNTRRMIQELRQNVTYASAFSVATGSRYVAFSNGQALILPRVIMNLGQDYNETTGVYTVPKNGLYTFHVTALSEKGCTTKLYIDANGKVLGRLFAEDSNDWDQSSITVVADLNVGDSVSAIFTGGGCALHNNQYTVYSGSLLKVH